MVYVFLADGFEEVEAIAPIDMLRRAGVHVILVKIKALKKDVKNNIDSKAANVLLDNQDEFTVTGSHNIEVRTDLTEKEIIFSETPEKLREANKDVAHFEHMEEYSVIQYVQDLTMIVLPGGAVGVENLYNSEIVQKIIDYCVENKIPVGAICAAPSILARRGYLNGVRATAHPSFRHYLTDNGAVMEETEKVVTDGIFTTAAAAGVSLEFGLELVRILKGEEEAEKIGKQILFY